MRPLRDLISTDDPGWENLFLPAIQQSTLDVQILPFVSKKDAERALYYLQVTTRSPLGSLAYMTGGLLLDYGWVRLFGGGNQLLPSLTKANDLDEKQIMPGYTILGYDVIGGVFAIDTWELGIQKNAVCYYSPDTLEWESLDMGYTDFLMWVFENEPGNNLESFYSQLRWSSWKQNTAALSLDHVFYLYPPLFTAEGQDVEKAAKHPVPVAELFNQNFSK
jgi:hypothetical protein